MIWKSRRINGKKFTEVKLQNFVIELTKNGFGLQIKSAQTMTRQGYSCSSCFHKEKSERKAWKTNEYSCPGAHVENRSPSCPWYNGINSAHVAEKLQCAAALLQRPWKKDFFCPRRALRLITFLIGTCGSVASWKRSGNERALDSRMRSRWDLNGMIRGRKIDKERERSKRKKERKSLSLASSRAYWRKNEQKERANRHVSSSSFPLSPPSLPPSWPRSTCRPRQRV